MQIEIWIPGRLPGENEIIKAAKSGKGRHSAYARMKKTWGNYVAEIFRRCELDPVEAVFVDIEWIEPDRRRDPDNIAAGKKFVFDGMVEAGFLKNDGWRQVLGWAESFKVNPKNCGVSLKITTIRKAVE